MRIALGIEYDGAGFNGWQTQSDGRSVQDALESALAELAGHRVATICAGRTDAGVHAIDQVVHFDTTAERPLTAWVRGTNRFLPDAVSVRWARTVGEDFHARFGALRRTYDFWIVNEPVRSPLAHARATWVFRPLDVAAMQQGARLLVGRHDFSSFRSAECQAASPVRDLQQLDVGSLVAIGIGRHPPEWLGDVLNARDRTHAAPTLGAAGLYLARVEYDARFELPAPEAVAPHRFDAYANQDLWPDA